MSHPPPAKMKESALKRAPFEQIVDHPVPLPSVICKGAFPAASIHRRVPTVELLAITVLVPLATTVETPHLRRSSSI